MTGTEVKKRRRRKKIDPDKLQHRVLALLESEIAKLEKQGGPSDRNEVEATIKISDHLRRLNADMASVFDTRALSKLSDAELEELERKASGG